MLLECICSIHSFIVPSKKQSDIFKSLTWQEVDSTENIETLDEIKADNEQMLSNYHLSIKLVCL